MLDEVVQKIGHTGEEPKIGGLYVCRTCGHVTAGTVPEACPVCGHERTGFIAVT